MKNRISICSNCGFPLISTLAFSYAERYCMNCGGQFGIMSVDCTDITPEMKPFITKMNRRFGQVRRYLIGGGMRLVGCEKCNEHEVHLQHATAKENKKYEWALKKLKEWEGSFRWRE
jgi:hypothetical protein